MISAFLLVALSMQALTQAERNPQTILNQAVADFRSGRLRESAAGFDRLAAMAPELMPELWQRGIALYYVGRYGDCRAQFEAHRTVNPNDVENAAWHFLCVARAASPTEARKALLPVGPDPRTPMRQIYEMFRGTTTPEAVLLAAGADLESQFYAHLYVGLYYEATGNEKSSREQIEAATADRYALVGGYMFTVAQVDLGRR
jgi:lipoprotein NlpI